MANWRRDRHPTPILPSISSAGTAAIPGSRSRPTRCANGSTKPSASCKRSNPGGVLEIGCGTGMLLFRLAPRCREYAALDFSRVALDYVANNLRQVRGPLPQVRLFHRTAEELDDAGAGPFDTIILNSVVQYFPNVQYLLRVLERLTTRLRPGGTVFIGDVRALHLSGALHASVECHKAGADTTAAELRQRIAASGRPRRGTGDRSRVLPGAQTASPGVSERAAPAQTRPLPERTQSLPLRRDPAHRAAHRSRSVLWLDAAKQPVAVETIRQRLEQDQPAALGLRHVPNARLAREARLLEALESDDRTASVAELQSHRAGDTPDGIDPEEWWTLAGQARLRGRSALVRPRRVGSLRRVIAPSTSGGAAPGMSGLVPGRAGAAQTVVELREQPAPGDVQPSVGAEPARVRWPGNCRNTWCLRPCWFSMPCP
jgi:SAM-dependent methyltransferase